MYNLSLQKLKLIKSWSNNIKSYLFLPNSSYVQDLQMMYETKIGHFTNNEANTTLTKNKIKYWLL